MGRFGAFLDVMEKDKDYRIARHALGWGCTADPVIYDKDAWIVVQEGSCRIKVGETIYTFHRSSNGRPMVVRVPAYTECVFSALSDMDYLVISEIKN